MTSGIIKILSQPKEKGAVLTNSAFFDLRVFERQKPAYSKLPIVFSDITIENGIEEEYPEGNPISCELVKMNLKGLPDTAGNCISYLNMIE